MALNQRVLGSSPSASTIFSHIMLKWPCQSVASCARIKLRALASDCGEGGAPWRRKFETSLQGVSRVEPRSQPYVNRYRYPTG